MKILKNPFLQKLGALIAIGIVAWIPLTAACSDVCDGYSSNGTTCFSYDGPCQFPAGTKLCMKQGTCVGDYNSGYRFNYTTSCVTIGGSTPAIVKGEFCLNGIWYPTSITWSQAGATTCNDAKAFFTAQFSSSTFCGVRNLSCTSSSYSTPGKVCFSKVGRCITSPVTQNDPWPEAYRYIGYIECPNGSRFDVKPVSMADAAGVKWCAPTFISVKLPGPCPICN